MSYRTNIRMLRLLLATSVGAAGPGLGLASAQAETREHTVQPGETVSDIASGYGLSSLSIMAANALPNPDMLQVGQSLVIPPRDGILHTVQAGETLLGLADRYQVSGADLVE